MGAMLKSYVSLSASSAHPMLGLPSAETLSGAVAGLLAGLLRPAAICPDLSCAEVHCSAVTCGGEVVRSSLQAAGSTSGFSGFFLVLFTAIVAFAGGWWLRSLVQLPHGRRPSAISRSLAWGPGTRD